MVNDIKNMQRSGWCFTARMEVLCADVLFVEINAANPNLMGKKYGKEHAP